MPNRIEENPFHTLLYPRSIATVGAGNNPMKMGTMHALSIVKGGYQGKVYPIHPKEKTVAGLPAYPAVRDLPEAPDLAVLIIPTEAVPQTLEDFAAIGTRRAVIISAGFKETGEAGVRLEEQVKGISRRTGMRFLGPNCIGFMNTAISLNTTVISIDNSPGALGLISQSGTYISQALPYLLRKEIRYSKAISIGNEASMTIVEALEYLGADEQTKAIACYFEGLKDGRRFIEAAQRVTPDKPVVALYSGGSAAGARSSRSHTGALASPAYFMEGVFRQAGIIQVQTLEEMFVHSWALATAPRLRGKRVGIVTNSGGPGTSIATVCEHGGMTIPVFSEGLQSAIKQRLASHSPCGNPVDMTFNTDMELLSLGLPETVMKSDEVDGIVMHGPMGSGFLRALYPNVKDLLGGLTLEGMLEQTKRDLSRQSLLPHEYGIPIVVSSLFDRSDNYINAYAEGGVTVCDSPEKAARVMLALASFLDVRSRRQPGPRTLPPVSGEAQAIIAGARGAGRLALDEHEAKLLLAAYGIPVSRETLSTTVEEAVQAAALIGYPVAAKACSPEILHKTGKGLIALGLSNEGELRKAFASIRESAGSPVPVLVQEMVSSQRELVVGMTHFPGFGPGVLFGLGGVFTEAFRDVSVRVAPLSLEEADEMLDDIRARSVLGEFRGMPAADRGALGRLLQTLGAIALLHPEIAEMDCNPVMLRNGAPVVVDALIALGQDD